MANIGMVIVEPEAQQYREIVSADGELVCECGSTRFIELEKTRYANGMVIDRSCVGCGLAYRLNYQGGYELSDHGGTESPIYHAQYLIEGVHSPDLIISGLPAGFVLRKTGE